MVEKIGGNMQTSMPRAAAVQQPAGIEETRQLAGEHTFREEKTVKMDVYPKEQLDKAVSNFNDFIKTSPNTHLKFEYHEELNEYYVTLVNDETDEVVREIPAKKMLDVFAAMTEYLGLMVDKKI